MRHVMHLWNQVGAQCSQSPMKAQGERGDLGELKHYVAPNSTKVHTALKIPVLYLAGGDLLRAGEVGHAPLKRGRTVRHLFTYCSFGKLGIGVPLVEHP